jgi:hypothetical protein
VAHNHEVAGSNPARATTPEVMAIRVCACIGCASHPGSCPELTTTRHCNTCRPVHERARGTKQQRGYDRHHDHLRERWRPRVERGLVDCHADPCIAPQLRIQPGEAWHLDHTAARTGYRGPAHARCNTSAGGRAAHGG